MFVLFVIVVIIKGYNRIYTYKASILYSLYFVLIGTLQCIYFRLLFGILYIIVFSHLVITLSYRLTAFLFSTACRYFRARFARSSRVIPLQDIQKVSPFCPFHLLAYCGKALCLFCVSWAIATICLLSFYQSRTFHSTRCVVTAGSFRISPLRQIVYYLPSARIHCPIYM